MQINNELKFTPEPIINPKTQKVENVINRPYIRLRLGYNHKLTTTPVGCLLDSGSDKNLFPASWGESIGLKVKSGRELNIYGIGGIKIAAYRHSIHIYMVDIDIDFQTFADFSYHQNVPLLGRCGFFDHFKKVIFDEEKEVMKFDK